MADMDPADFYTGLVAELYSPLKSTSQDPGRYVEFVRECGEPALELGCGDGDPLLHMRGLGLDVEGVDSSPDMLDRCRTRAAELGMHVVVHQQRMEALDLPRRYKSIFLAGPTFNLIPDDDTAAQALHRICAHLADGGTALVPLFIPAPTAKSRFGVRREATADDGAMIAVSITGEDRDETARTQHTNLRYESNAGGEQTVVDRPWTLHWYSAPGFRALAVAAGLRASLVADQSGNVPPEDATEFTFRLQRAS